MKGQIPKTSCIFIDEPTIRREYAALEAKPDKYENMVVSLDDIAIPSNQGFRRFHVWDLSGFF